MTIDFFSAIHRVLVIAWQNGRLARWKTHHFSEKIRNWWAMGSGGMGTGGRGHPAPRYGAAHHMAFGCGHAHLTVMAKRVGVTWVGRTEVRRNESTQGFFNILRQSVVGRPRILYQIVWVVILGKKKNWYQVTFKISFKVALSNLNLNLLLQCLFSCLQPRHLNQDHLFRQHPPRLEFWKKRYVWIFFHSTLKYANSTF